MVPFKAWPSDSWGISHLDSDVYRVPDSWLSPPRDRVWRHDPFGHAAWAGPQCVLAGQFPAELEPKNKWEQIFCRRAIHRKKYDWLCKPLSAQQQEWSINRARNLWARYYSMFDERHVSEMSGTEFERFVGKLYTRLAYSVSLTPGGADQGVDMILCKDGRKIAVQAKRWAGPVGNRAVQEAIAGKLYYGCSHALIITTSTFSNSAVALAAKDPTISLVDGNALSKLCQQFKAEPIPNFSWDEWEKIKDVAELFA